MTRLYRVTHVIDVLAETARGAAEAHKKAITDQYSIATLYTVAPWRNKKVSRQRINVDILLKPTAEEEQFDAKVEDAERRGRKKTHGNKSAHSTRPVRRQER